MKRPFPLIFLAIASCTPEPPEPVGVPTVSPPSAVELDARRSALVSAHPDGLHIFPANPAEKAMEQPSWIQAPSFQYFSGLHGLPGAVLVVDAPMGRTVLFVAPAPAPFGVPVRALDAVANPGLVAGAALDEVLPTSQFVPWLTGRLERVPVVYLDEPRRAPPAGVPAGMRPVQGAEALWELSLRDAFPQAQLRSNAETVRRLRWRKSATEIATLRFNAEASGAALRAGMQTVAPGVTQRQAEAAVVGACIQAGAEGPSFWPWMQSGPNAHVGSVVRSFLDYHHLNRVMTAGELVRADIGCASGGYGGDVGRTVPVSARFTPAQAAVWDLLVTGYLAGVGAMAPGVEISQVAEASREGIARAAESDTTLAELAAALNGPQGVNWHVHGVGIESGETDGGPLEEGVVLAYEPMVVVGPDAFYLEDMILITADGAEVLTGGLPYSAAEMEAFLRRR